MDVLGFEIVFFLGREWWCGSCGAEGCGFLIVEWRDGLFGVCEIQFFGL